MFLGRKNPILSSSAPEFPLGGISLLFSACPPSHKKGPTVFVDDGGGFGNGRGKMAGGRCG